MGICGTALRIDRDQVLLEPGTFRCDVSTFREELSRARTHDCRPFVRSQCEPLDLWQTDGSNRSCSLRGHVLGGLLDETRQREAIDDFVGLSIQRHGMTAMLGHVLDLRDNLTVYDASHVVLAQALDAPLITTDDKSKEAERPDVVVQVVRPGAAG